MRVLEIEHKHPPVGVAYGRTGRQLVAVSADQFVIWSLESFERESTVDCNYPLPALHGLFITGGRAFLDANGYWYPGEELPTGKLSQTHEEETRGFSLALGFLCFGHDGRAVLRESHGELWHSPQRLALWDFAGKCIHPFPQAGLIGPRHAAFSPDGTILALRSESGAVTLWDTLTSEQIAEMEHPYHLNCLTFSPDGRSLATSARRLVRVWSVPEGKCVHRFRAFRAFSDCHAFSADSRLLLAGSREGRVRIWEVNSGRELADHDWDQGSIHDVAFSPDGLTAAAACNKAVVVWDIDE